MALSATSAPVLHAELRFNDDDPPTSRDKIHEVRVSLRSPGPGACALAADANFHTEGLATLPGG